MLAGLGQEANYGEAEVGKIGGCFADVAAAAAAEESRERHAVHGVCIPEGGEAEAGLRLKRNRPQ